MMHKILLIAAMSSLCFALEPKKVEDMSCMELLDSIKVLQKLKESEQTTTYEGVERVAAALLTRTVYFGDRRSRGDYIDVKDEILKLKAKLPDCKPY